MSVVRGWSVVRLDHTEGAYLRHRTSRRPLSATGALGNKGNPSDRGEDRS